MGGTRLGTRLQARFTALASPSRDKNGKNDIIIFHLNHPKPSCLTLGGVLKRRDAVARSHALLQRRRAAAGTLPANSVVLGTFSSVFRNAIEANTAGNASRQQLKSNTDRASPGCTIPLSGISKQQWLRVAEFLYPVVPSPKIKDWDEAEQLLEIGKKFDLQLLMYKVDLYLESRAGEMYASARYGDYFWKWFKLVDGAGLTGSLGAIASRIVIMHKSSCKSPENLQGLSPAAIQALTAALVDLTVLRDD